MANYSAVLDCIADTYLTADGPLSNYGSYSVLRVGGINHTLKSVLAFDISSIPADKEITGIDMYLYINGFTSQAPTVDGREYNTSHPFVVKARRLYAHKYNEVETTLTYNKIYFANEEENLATNNNGLNDSELNISASSGEYVVFPIYDIQRTEDNKIIVGLRLNTFYTSSSQKMQLCYVNISSREGAYTPYIVVYYRDPLPAVPTDLVPNATTRNKLGEITLSWQNASIQTGFTLQYSTNNFASYTTVTGGAENTYTIPANTFTDGQTVKWRVRITDNLNSLSDWSETASFTIGATPPSMPSPVSPVDTTVNSSDVVYFRWRFIDQYGYLQGKFDLQYKRFGETETNVTVNTSTLNYSIPANTLSGGYYQWRVRCYNQFGEISPWTDWQNFYSIGKPDTPIITGISNNMHPTITWQSPERDLFRIKIYAGANVIYDTDEQTVSDLTQFTVPIFLDNGNYRAGLQVSNVYGLWSTEAIYNFAISTAKPNKPAIYGNGTNEFTTVLIIESQTSTNLIYRKGNKDKDYQLIATITGNTFTDYLASHGNNSYFVRAITDSGFMDSDPINVNLDFKGIVLNCTSDYTNRINLWKTLNADKRKSISLTKDQYLVHTTGRTYPIAQSTEFKDYTESHEYVVIYDEYDKVFELLNCNELIYRNDKGYRFPVQVSALNISENELGLYVVTFTLNRLEG